MIKISDLKKLEPPKQTSYPRSLDEDNLIEKKIKENNKVHFSK